MWISFVRIRSIILRQVSSFFALLYYSSIGIIDGVNKDKRSYSIIVTLTSYPRRFHTIHLALKSLLNQTVKPDRIILYLDDSVDDNCITPQMHALEKCGVEIRKRPIDMKAHKKYFYAMQENPDAIIITVDDDCMYRRDLVERLIRSYRLHPNAISAKRVHRISFDNLGRPKAYNEWEHECISVNKPSMELCATGVGGVLYPPHLLNSMVFDVDLFMKLSPLADDLWLKYIEIYSGVPVVRASGKYNLSFIIQCVQKIGLREKNVSKKENDTYIRRLEDYFKFDWNELITIDDGDSVI